MANTDLCKQRVKVNLTGVIVGARNRSPPGGQQSASLLASLCWLLIDLNGRRNAVIGKHRYIYIYIYIYIYRLYTVNIQNIDTAYRSLIHCSSDLQGVSKIDRYRSHIRINLEYNYRQWRYQWQNYDQHVRHVDVTTYLWRRIRNLSYASLIDLTVFERTCSMRIGLTRNVYPFQVRRTDSSLVLLWPSDCTMTLRLHCDPLVVPLLCGCMYHCPAVVSWPSVCRHVPWLSGCPTALWLQHLPATGTVAVSGRTRRVFYRFAKRRTFVGCQSDFRAWPTVVANSLCIGRCRYEKLAIARYRPNKFIWMIKKLPA